MIYLLFFFLNLPSTSKVQWVDKAQRSGTSSTTGGQVTDEVTPELGVLVNTTQEDLQRDKIHGYIRNQIFRGWGIAPYLLVLVLEGKVQSLSWEISNNVGQVTAPVCSNTLFLWNADKAINHTLVLLVGADLFRDVLNLQQQLHTLNGCDGSL